MRATAGVKQAGIGSSPSDHRPPFRKLSRTEASFLGSIGTHTAEVGAPPKPARDFSPHVSISSVASHAASVELCIQTMHLGGGDQVVLTHSTDFIGLL